jgi:chaperone BCS1
LQADYESFFQREAWFRQNHLAFRRGYLLYGPPGNGKTSAVRAMLSGQGITGYTINLFKQGLNDDDLTSLFQTAALSAPAIIVLEDIDRYFDQKQEDGPEAKVSLQHLLNCLDGATTQDGVIVVATANNPQTLDPAILRRPGRFDRVVGFANPTKDLRVRYFQKLCADMDSASIDACADAGDGFSFAQLQESYILAGQFAFDEQRSITPEDILSAINTLRKALQGADWKGEGASGSKVERR